MKAEDKHNWKLISKEFGTTHECVDCGCIITKTRKWTCYSRSGIPFGDKRPDCIKEEIESKKTID